MRNETGPGRITEISFRELTKITKFFNIHGLNPIIIGGWAVYYYTKGAGSIDIDLVLPSKEAVRAFEKCSKQYGFARDKRAKIRALFRKQTETGSGTGEIELDIFVLTSKNLLASRPSIEIPWRLSEKYSEEWRIAENTIARIPEREVLLLYKAAALLDRQFKLKNWADLSKPIRDRLRAKIAKDKKDIESLLGLGINEEMLNMLLKKTGFGKEFRLAVRGFKGVDLNIAQYNEQ